MKLPARTFFALLLSLLTMQAAASQSTQDDERRDMSGVFLQSQEEGDSEPDITELFGGQVKNLAPPAPLMTNVGGRETRSLNGAWNVVVDEHDIGAKGLFGTAYYDVPAPLSGMELVEFSFDSRRQLQVPGDWNAQDERLFRYRDSVWYQRDFQLGKKQGERYFLHFDGVNYKAHVYLNGKSLATHIGGYTAFNVEITEAAQDGANYLVVRVDAYLDDTTIPTKRTSDFFKYGGIVRDVNLVSVPATFVRQYQVYLQDREAGKVSGWVQLDGAGAAEREVTLSIAELGVKQPVITDAGGRAEFSLTTKQLELWSPENPRLYDVALSVDGHELHDRIGFRSIEVHGKQIVLNGEPVFLRGISLHDEATLHPGMANSRADAEAQLGLAKELKANFVRLAHYPHNEHTLRVADELGLMVWSEIPIVSLIDWDNPETLETAKGLVSDNVHRDMNRAAIVLWSIANESMPQSPERLAFLSELAKEARALDASGRPLAAALVGDPREFRVLFKHLLAAMLVDPEIDDPGTRAKIQGMASQLIGDEAAIEALRQQEIEVMLSDGLGEVVDVVGYNEYFGWYYSAGLARMLPVDEATTRRTMFGIMKDVRFRNAFGKPIVISEFGAGAKKGYVSDKGPGMIWSEEYQAKVYEHQIEMLQRSDFVQGMSPWILKDFRSAMRSLNGIQELYNRKGIVSETGERKKAFYVLRDFYAQKAQH